MMEQKRTRTTDEEITIELKKSDRGQRANTTDEEISIEFMHSGNNVTHQPKDYEEIEY
ncbi:hypothetical protein ABET52_17140 [Saccharococcus caldoxylosilyticus]|jgi:hypothetical protein|uniref:Uncharacterized protein n=2 Tax=Anoxybacillaceae TaxID=3120669 RepID=A0A150LEU7_9BACL|nr:hypothetical protein [Parageobacillus caldoxylosilyticus]KYD10549.1 hypothetical protein B4119_0889 [Parageobacillus caldoxylosilyticus]